MDDGIHALEKRAEPGVFSVDEVRDLDAFDPLASGVLASHVDQPELVTFTENRQ